MDSENRTAFEEVSTALPCALKLYPAAEQIIHLGAGTAGWVGKSKQFKLNNIVLVDALPKAAVRLQAVWAPYPMVEVVCAAVADFSGKGTLHEYNLGNRTSLKRPGELARSYPGLRLKREHEVEVICIANFLKPYLAGDQTRHLIVDLPGEAFATIQSLAKSCLLRKFWRITLCGDLRPQYEDEAPISDALEMLQQHCFEIIQTSQGHEGFDAQWTLAFNPDKNALKAAEAQIARLEEELASARAQIEQIILTADHQRATEQRMLEILESQRMPAHRGPNE